MYIYRYLSSTIRFTFYKLQKLKKYSGERGASVLWILKGGFKSFGCYRRNKMNFSIGIAICINLEQLLNSLNFDFLNLKIIKYIGERGSGPSCEFWEGGVKSFGCYRRNKRWMNCNMHKSCTTFKQLEFCFLNLKTVAK